MSLPPKLPASRLLDVALDSQESPPECEHPLLLALACASLIIAVAADLLTAVVFTGSISGFIPRCLECNVQPNLTGITTFLRVASTAAVVGTAGSLTIGILVLRYATQRPETSDVARVATVGIRFSAPAILVWGIVLCGYLFFAATSLLARP